jgi:hypothetical protein
MRYNIHNGSISYISLSLGDFDAHFLKTNEELSLVDLSVSIIGVEGLVSSSEASDGGGSSLIKLFSESVQYYTQTTL